MMHKKLEIWKKSIALVKMVYIYTQDFPKDELYGIVSQIRRCAVSIPSNIAEGAARNTEKDYIRFLYIASGSLAELETQIIISNELTYLSDDKYSIILKDLNEISRMLQGMIRYLREKVKSEELNE